MHVCEHCGREFNENSNRRKHIEKVHKIPRSEQTPKKIHRSDIPLKVRQRIGQRRHYNKERDAILLKSFETRTIRKLRDRAIKELFIDPKKLEERDAPKPIEKPANYLCYIHEFLPEDEAITEEFYLSEETLKSATKNKPAAEAAKITALYEKLKEVHASRSKKQNDSIIEEYLKWLDAVEDYRHQNSLYEVHWHERHELEKKIEAHYEEEFMRLRHRYLNPPARKDPYNSNDDRDYEDYSLPPEMDESHENTPEPAENASQPDPPTNDDVSEPDFDDSMDDLENLMRDAATDLTGVKNRIRKALELGRHPNTPKTESAHALRKANDLMMKYNLIESDIFEQPAQPPQQPEPEVPVEEPEPPQEPEVPVQEPEQPQPRPNKRKAPADGDPRTGRTRHSRQTAPSLNVPPLEFPKVPEDNTREPTALERCLNDFFDSLKVDADWNIFVFDTTTHQVYIYPECIAKVKDAGVRVTDDEELPEGRWCIFRRGRRFEDIGGGKRRELTCKMATDVKNMVLAANHPDVKHLTAKNTFGKGYNIGKGLVVRFEKLFQRDDGGIMFFE